MSFGEKLTQLSTDLFELVRLDAHDVTLSMQTFPYNELVMDILQRYEVESQALSLELVAKIGGYGGGVTQLGQCL